MAIDNVTNNTHNLYNFIYGTRNSTLQRVFLSPDCSLWSEKYHCCRATNNAAHFAVFNPVIKIVCLYGTVNVTHYVI
jgi:hypothetical protein